MALVHLNATVGTTATRIVKVQSGLTRNVAVQVQNLDAASIFVGDATITTAGASRGHAIVANATFQFWLNPGDEVYAISAAGTTAGAVVITYSGK
jgi:hypothetical protein